MADIELVIKINENIWERICDSQSVPDMLNIDIVNGLNAIKKGTPLPKGHGALVDRSEVIKSLFDYHNGKKTLGQCIEDVQTIIEADWEDEEE